MTTDQTTDRYYLDLKGARERLCRAQVTALSPDKAILQEAIRCIDLVGMDLPQWSEHDQPDAPRDVTRGGDRA